MPQVFVFHHLEEEKTKNFFQEIFCKAKVKAVWGNCREMMEKDVLVQEVKIQIQGSDSLFLLLSRNIMNDPRARDWFYWVSGYAKNRDVWIVQPYDDLKEISVPFYEFKHQVVFCLTPAWSDYLTQAVINRHSLMTVSPLLAGLHLGMDSVVLKEYFDETTSFPLSDCSMSRPVRFLASCPRNKTIYTLHMPEDMRITRCPDCHDFFTIQPAFKSKLQTESIGER